MDTTVRGHRIIAGGFPSRAAAEEWIYRIRADRAALEEYLRTRIIPESPTVDEVMSYYREHRGGLVATAERHCQYERHLSPELGPLRADAIRQRDVDRYVDVRAHQGAAPKTAHNELCYLRTCLRYAWRNDLLAAPPKFVLHAPRCERSRVAYPEEARRLLALADLPLRRVIAAAWVCGLRRGEVLAARWEWVNVLRREINLPAGSTKTGAARTVAVPEELWELIAAEPRHPVHVFCRWRRGRNGRGALEVVPWTKRTLHGAFEELRRKAGATGLWFHDLRRSMATVAQERGHAPSAVQRVGGWEDPGVMQRHYSHAGRTAQDAVVKDMAGALGLGAPAEAEQPDQLQDPRRWN